MAGEWIECALADACSSIDYGLTASASDDETGPRFLRITDVVSGHIDWNAVPHVAAGAETAEKYRLHDGDVVLARTGASTGASAYVKDPPPAVFASYLVRLKARPDFDSRFLAYYLKSDDFWTFIRGVLGDKSAQPNASASTMTKAPLRAPRDKSEQRAIAHILGTLDDKIELNRRMSETLEAMARALFKSWFVDFDPVRAKAEGRDPGLPKPIADLFPDRLVDSELGEIPEGWEVGTLADLSALNPEVWARRSRPAEINYVDLANTKWGPSTRSRRMQQPTHQ
ncbi:MAG: restriction endonuclease subunit S, partial [Gemmatimonadetes bacterium]|nr:restriction endonuclease subunit S [Gemmatimonadota bacterium]